MIDEWHYRKKPVVVEAFQLSDEIGAKNPLWIIASMQEGNFRMATGGWEVVTLEGVMLAGIGDWIIKGTKGEIYPCKPDIFAEIYEPVSAGPGQFIEKVVELASECHRLAGSIELGPERERMFSIYSVLHNLGRAGYAEEVCRRMNPLVPDAVCVWIYDDADYHWQTACGSAWAFTEGDPKENGCNFCHSCGKQLVTADGGEDE